MGCNTSSDSEQTMTTTADSLEAVAKEEENSEILPSSEEKVISSFFNC